MSTTPTDLTKAFDKTNRELMYTKLIEKGLPIELVRLITKTHQNTQLRARERNKLAQKTETNRGVFQGSPLSALLFIIYTDSMMERYDELWKEKKQRMLNMGFRMNQSIKIKTKSEAQEIEWTEKNMLKKGFRETWDTKFKEKEMEADIAEQEIELDHIEYADDTNLINPSPQTELPKLQCYKKAAEEYDLEIQWKKTCILRRNVAKENEGQSAGLPPPFHEVKQAKKERMLGLEISINGAQGEMVKDRLVKAEKAWVIGRKFFLNTKIEKKNKDTATQREH